MACNTLLMSDDAEFSVKPELEIFADDVQCAHGATVADIVKSHLYYLMSRGIPEKKARFADQRLRRRIVEELEERAARRGPGRDHHRLAGASWLTRSRHGQVTTLRPSDGISRSCRARSMARSWFSRQCRLGPEAEAGDRRDQPRLFQRICQCASWPAFPVQCRDGRL